MPIAALGSVQLKGYLEQFSAYLDKEIAAAPVIPKYVRPNGQVYVPRTVNVNGTSYEDVRIIQTARQRHMPVLLFGNPGTGKTALVEAAIAGVITVNGTRDTETSDFIGSYTQDEAGKYVWVDGPLLVAAEEGRTLLIDEIALIDPRVLSTVYSVMDGRDVITVSANPTRGDVHVKEGFVVMGTCNPNAPGAVMSDALLSRFLLHVEMRTDWNVAKMLGASTKMVLVAKNLQTKAASGIVSAAPELREVLAFTQVKEAFGEDFALANVISQAREEDRDEYSKAIAATFSSNVAALTF